MKWDWYLLAGLALICALSLLTLLSVNREYFISQLLWYAAAFAVIFILSLVDWRWLGSHRSAGRVFYAVTILLLIFTLIAAPVIRGIRAWLVFGPLRFQAGELVKASLILIYAGFFAKRHLEVSLFKNIFSSFLYFAVPAFLISRQPDLGTVIVLFFIWSGFLLVNGLRWKRLLVGFVILLAAAVVLWTGFLEPYQKERIVGFLFPSFDPLGINYNVNQSKIAVGSGGFLGKGFGQGTQTQLGFLPEAETDFLFAAFVEEWGFLGGFLLIAAVLFTVSRIVKIGRSSSGNYAKFICLGTVFLISAHFFLNVGSNLGFSPVVGVTFPFFSYGGSSLLTLSVLFGIIQNIARESSF